MFGYVVLNKPEIKFKDYDLYRSFYCGLCRELKDKYNIAGQLSLTYDMTFVVVLLSALYEMPNQKGTTRCIVHPICKQPVRRNLATSYAADMNIVLSYYKCIDDWNDEKEFLKYAYSIMLKKSQKKLSLEYRNKCEKIVTELKLLSHMEKNGETDIDKISGCSGHIMEEILAYKNDMWEKPLRKIGFYLGKFIYLMDAYDDIEKDIKNNSYNPFKEVYKKDGFEEYVRQILIMMMSEVCREFEKLPILKYQDILRNILYSGVWCRFELISAKRRKERDQC